MAKLEIRNMTRRTPTPGFPFARAARAVLPGWDISLVFVGTARAKSLNESLRGKTYTPNVLSYTSGPNSGEVIICPEIAKKQASSYDMTYTRFAGFLFIHALLHLKGERHGTTMDKSERALLARITGDYTNGATNRNRHRHRHVPSKGRRR